MKNTKTCPKCNNTDILVVSNDGYPMPDHGNNILAGKTLLSGPIAVMRYICCHCGYTEEWLDLSDIEKIKNSKKSLPVNQ